MPRLHVSVSAITVVSDDKAWLPSLTVFRFLSGAILAGNLNED